jgi:hypothetical protein
VIELAIAGLVIVAIHLACLHGLGPRLPQGDECDYLARSQWRDPHRPELFLRVPLMPAFARAVGRFTGTPEATLRTLVALSGAFAAWLVFAAGLRVGGTLVAVIAVGAMMLLLERVLLSAHLWPDTLLSALHALALLLLTLPSAPPSWLALGGVAALATMLRVEQLALGVGLALVLIVREPGAWLPIVGATLGPSLLALLAWTAVAWRRYRIALPDTTWTFNLRILDRQLAQANDGPVSVQGSIVGLLAADRTTDASPWRALRARPLAWLGSILRRAAACIGPDTFVEGRLLPPLGQAYPRMTARTAARLRPWLRWSFPMLVAIWLWAGIASGSRPDFLLATLPVLGAIVAVHFRSRYRLVLMPWVSLAVATSIVAVDPAKLGAPEAAVATLLALLTWRNVRHPLVVEDLRQAAPRA